MKRKYKKYAIKDNVALFVKRTKKGKIKTSFLFEHSRLIHSFSVSEETLRCLKLFNGEMTICDIAIQLGLRNSDVVELCDYLIGKRIVHEVKYQQPDFRFSRQLNFFSSFENHACSRSSYHENISNSKIAVLGLGGIGSWLVETLARCGIGEFTLIDPDVVDESNLPRQALYLESDIQNKKVDAAAIRIKLIDKKIKTNCYDVRIHSEDELSPLIEGASVVVNCSDEPDVTTTNNIVTGACFKKGVPHVLCGGYDGHSSYIGQSVIPHLSSCWMCYTESGIYEKGLKRYKHVPITKSSIQGGTIAPISAITANLHALEVIKLISNYSQPAMINRKAEVDYLSYALNYTSIPRNPKCPLCGNNKNGN